MKNKLSILLVIASLFMVVSCGKPQTPENVLPEDTQAFLEAVDNIEFNFDCMDEIEYAFSLYDALGDDSWNYDEVLDAFNILVQMEELIKDYEAAQYFISIVDNIPYIVTLEDKIRIDSAYLAYEVLSEAAKSYLDVDKAYERLEDAKTTYDLLKEAQAGVDDQIKSMEFILLAKEIPALNVFILEDVSYVEACENYYLTLSDTAKAMDDVIKAYEIVLAARAHYELMLEDPTILEGVIITRFIELVNALPSIENITLNSLEDIEKAEEAYRELSSDAKALEEVVLANNTLKSLRTRYNELAEEKELQDRLEAEAKKLEDFLKLVEDLPTVEELTKTHGEKLANARLAYNALPANVLSNEEVKAALELIVALEEKYNTFDLQKITFPSDLYNILSSGGTAPNLVLQGSELSFYKNLKSMYGVSSNEDLAKCVDLYLYIFHANDINPDNYVYYGSIESTLARCSNVVGYGTVVNFLQEASKTDSSVVSGNYRFGIKVVDCANKYADSDIFMGTYTIAYTFTSLYEDENTPDVPVDVIEISTKEEFLAIANNLSGNYVLTADIDLENIEWVNLGKFSGTLDGRGHRVYNIAHSNGGDATFGIFEDIIAGGKVSRLVLEGTITDAGAWAGAICVRNYGIIENCIIKLNISSLGQYGYIGGVVCDNNSIIRNCLVLSNVDPRGSIWGDLSGSLCINNNGSITDTFACKDNTLTTKDIHANNGSATNSGSYTTNGLKNSALYSNWDSSIWNIVEGEIPTLKIID
jgi:tetratricopeptide (TPR) repeat protein